MYHLYRRTIYVRYTPLRDHFTPHSGVFVTFPDITTFTYLRDKFLSGFILPGCTYTATSSVPKL